MANAKSEFNLRRAEDETMKCQLCANWGAGGKCSLLGIETIPQMVCDGFASLEAEPAAAQGEVSPDMLAGLFGG